MAVIFDGPNRVGGAERDYMLGANGGPNHDYNGAGGSDLLLGDISNFFLDATNNNSIGTASTLDTASVWSTGYNPLVDNSTTIPHTTAYVVGDNTGMSFYYVTVGAGQTITADTDFANFDTIVALLNSSGVILASNDDNASDEGSQFRGTESYVSYTNNTGAPLTVYVRVSEFGGATLETDDITLLHLSVTGHSASATVPVGDDTLYSGDDNDMVYGGEGNDVVFGEAGDDILRGGPGNDFVIGGDGADTVDGGDGDDFVYVEEGTIAGDFMDGGSGNDNLTFFGDGSTFYGLKNDTFVNFEKFYFAAQGGGGVIVNISAAQFQTNPFTEVVSEVRNDSNPVQIRIDMDGGVVDLSQLVLSPNWRVGHDSFSVSGLDGNDMMILTDGTDEGIGRGGNDTIEGGGAGDYLRGGDGAGDFVSYQFSPAAVSIDLAAGTYTGGDATGDDVSGFENILGSLHDDTLTGDSGVNTIIGSGGSDTLNGLDGGDFLFGGFGADRADGGAGDDFVRSGPDNDTLLGGDGNDTLGASNRTDLLRGGNGLDLLLGSNGNDRLFGDSGDDTLVGGNGRDILEGGTGADRMNGGDQTDTASYANAGSSVSASLLSGAGISGEAAGDVFVSIENLIGSLLPDTLIGSNGANRIQGNSGGDRLFGVGGNDILQGDQGNDTLDGGAGNDQFWYRRGDDADRIVDFDAGAGSPDVIRLFGFGDAFDTMQEIRAAATEVNGNTVINFGGGDTLTLLNVSIADLHANDFIFG